MASIPSYLYPCLASDPTGTNLYLAGVSSTTQGRLEVYSINFSNINSPTATFISNQTSALSWSSTAPKACMAYSGNAASTNSPILIAQFGSQSFFTNAYPNGSIELPANFQGVGVISPKLFSVSGEVGGLNWVTAVANVTSSSTFSPWTGLRFNSSAIVTSSRDFLLSTYPTSNPLLSVGAYVPSTNTPAQGYHVVFDTLGSGIIYTTLDSAELITSSLDRILSLSSPVPVVMGGYILTNNAFSLTMANVGYILDTASDGSTVLYSINPSQSTKLQRVSVPGNVPPFSFNMAATAVGSQIITYSAVTNGAVIFNSFDTVSGSWSGPGLVKPSVPSTPSGSSGSSPSNSTGTNSSGDSSSSKTPLGAIIGGVVGGLVVIALIAFLFMRNSRNNKRKAQADAVTGIQPQNGYHDPNKAQQNPAAAPLMDQNYVLQQQQAAMVQNQQYQQQPYQQQQYQQQPYQQQQQQYNPHQSYIPQQQQDVYSSGQPMTPIPAQNQQPVIFQAAPTIAQTQEPYNYTPPTLIPQPQPQSPNIFQPQTAMSPESHMTSPQHSYSHASTGGYVAPATPQTPASQAYTPPTHAAIGASPQYVAPSDGQGYAA